MSPYFFVGGGWVSSDPQPEYYGSTNDAVGQPPYGLPKSETVASSFISMPFGGGFRVELSPSFIICLEGSWHPVFNDTLDGVSQNGDPANNDWFVGLHLVATYCFTPRFK